MYIILVNIKMEGVWKELYHENILEEDSNQVNNTYVECLVSSKKKAKKIFDKEEAFKVNALFESEFRKGTILDLKTKKILEKVNPFPNGLESWQETHFEVVSFITANTIGTQDNYLTKIQESEGSTGLFDVARDWANEFEKLNAGREWDGEFFEEIEAFCKSKMS